MREKCSYIVVVANRVSDSEFMDNQVGRLNKRLPTAILDTMQSKYAL